MLTITTPHNSKRLTALITLAVVLVLSIVSLVVYRVYNSERAQAISNFIPGNIITDSKMSDYNAMSEAQIRTFINQRNANCSSSNSLCLRNYREGGKDAARLIYEAAQEQRINPQVILVTIQKEQGLVTQTSPAQWMYNTAMGYACPDSTPGKCGSETQGFLRQLVWGSTMYRAILDGGGRWSNRYASGSLWYTPYVLGNNSIQWSPTASCGSSTVNIQNRATQALYNYTPYRPNQAALDAGYGTGNSCSSYGNRNFFLYMRDWFGYVSSADAYSWSSVSQKVYYDQNRTQELPYNTVLHTDQTAYVEIKAKNTGGVTWQQSNTRLATSRANDRKSVFKDSSWPGDNRAARLVESSVAPGETGTFRFSITAPSSSGTYNEYFNIVLEGQAWLKDIGLYLPIRVTDARKLQYFSNSTHTTALSTSGINMDDPVHVRLTITNNTGATIPANARIATTNPSDRQSVLRHSSWISNDRVARVGTDIRRGGTADVSFILQPQNAIVTIDEHFGLVVDGQGWIEQDTIRIRYTTRERPKDRVETNKPLRTNDKIEAANGSRTFILQSDGNLVLYSGSKGVWSTKTVGTGADRLILQSDGNLVLYSGSKGVWSTKTVGL